LKPRIHDLGGDRWGDIELVELLANSVVLRLSGTCAQCPSAHMTLHLGVETAPGDARQQIEGSGAAEHQTIDARGSNQALRTRSRDAGDGAEEVERRSGE
jgi:Fe-S cluster biogenesis protein NfuA